MKKTLLSIALCAVFAAAGAQSQNAKSSKAYEPMSSWPYLFEEFGSGAVRTAKGNLLEYASLNVSVADGKLHYVEKGTIMQADMMNVYTARIGDDVFVNIYGKMYKVLRETEKGAVVELKTVDMEEMKKTDIGYGISSTTASKTNTSLSGIGVDSLLGAAYGVSIDSVPLSQAEQQKHAGSLLPLKEDTFFYVYRILVPATRRDVTNAAGVDKAEAKAFFKAHKIKWSNPESLMEVVDFLYGQFDRANKSANEEN